MKGYFAGSILFFCFCFCVFARQFSGAAFAQVVFSDLFVFRSGNSVYSLNKLHDYSRYLGDFQCFYPESLSSQYFKLLVSPPEGYFQKKEFKKNNQSEEYQRITSKFVGLVKLIRYASSQAVSVSSDLPKAFKMSAKKNNCSLRGFEGEKFNEQMRNLALLEVFLRSRFIPGNTAELTDKQKASILKNIQSLEESVKKQIEHELFEN